MIIFRVFADWCLVCVCAVEHDGSWHHRGSACGPAAQFYCAEESVAPLPVSDRGDHSGKLHSFATTLDSVHGLNNLCLCAQ